jgi:hypothetical protein
MHNLIPHIYKNKLGQNLHFALKYSDLEYFFRRRVEADVHLDVWFHANKAYWNSKRSRARREGQCKLLDISYRPTDRFRYWPEPAIPSSLVIRCAVYALPNRLAAEISLKRSVLREAIAEAVDHLTLDDLFKRRWQVIASLRIPERLVECVSLAWKDVKLVTAIKRVIDLNEDKQRGI